MTDTQILVGVLALLGVVVSAVVAYWQKATSDLVHALQVEVASLRDEVAGLKSRERIAEDYIDVLREHIENRQPPPPPPWPHGLTN